MIIGSGAPMFLYVRPYVRPEHRLQRLTAVPGWGTELCMKSGMDVLHTEGVTLLLMAPDLAVMVPNERPTDPRMKRRTRVMTPTATAVVEGRFLVTGFDPTRQGVTGLPWKYAPRLRYLHPMGKDAGPGILTWAQPGEKAAPFYQAGV